VRYSGRLGLLPAAPRNAAGHRRYDQGAVERLRLVKGAQRVGLRLREIAELLQVLDRASAPAATPRRCCASGLAEVDAELARLAALRGELARLLAMTPEQVCLHGGDGRWVVVRAGVCWGGRWWRWRRVRTAAAGAVSGRARAAGCPERGPGWRPDDRGVLDVGLPGDPAGGH
jgi:DNA-binding transcriptional MerR regulator